MFLHPRIVPLGIDLSLDKLIINILAVSIPDRRGMPLDCASLIGEIACFGHAAPPKSYQLNSLPLYMAHDKITSKSDVAEKLTCN